MNGNVLATGQHGPPNFTEAISNFVAPASGTYYIDIHGNNITYSLTVPGTHLSTPSGITPRPPPAADRRERSARCADHASGAPDRFQVRGPVLFDTSSGGITPDTNDAVRSYASGGGHEHRHFASTISRR